MWLFLFFRSKRKKTFLLSNHGSHVGNTKQFRSGRCIFLHLQQMSDIFFMFEVHVRQNMKFLLYIYFLGGGKFCEIWLTFHTKTTFNLTELLFIILVILCCSRTFLPHFLAKILNKHLLFFLLAVTIYNVINVQIIPLCEGLVLCS